MGKGDLDRTEKYRTYWSNYGKIDWKKKPKKKPKKRRGKWLGVF